MDRISAHALIRDEHKCDGISRADKFASVAMLRSVRLCFGKVV